MLADEYLQQELDDACEVIAWIARQPWCTGAVGMMGKSWGGFNALQIGGAAPAGAEGDHHRLLDRRPLCRRRPLHGRLRCSTTISGGARIMLAYQARPRRSRPRRRGLARAMAGAARRRCRSGRRCGSPHQRRDAYWRHGSVCEDYAAIACPVFAVGGWADAYTNAIPRLLDGLSVPRLGLIGPWAHVYPQDGKPGPAIGFLQEAVRWWDHWLKGRRHRHHGRADAARLCRGVVAARDWRDPRARPLGRRGVVALAADRAAASPRRRRAGLRREAAPARGDLRPLAAIDRRRRRASGWASASRARCRPTSASDDGLSLVFDSAPLTERMELLGAPEIELDRLGQAGGAALRAALRRRARRLVAARLLRRPQPHASRQPRRAERADARRVLSRAR